MATPADTTADGGVRRTRLEGISDGVIAVAITLLVLGIDPPDPAPGESLWQALDTGTLGSLGLFALSFIVIARFWMIHHDAMRGLPEVVPTRLVLVNFAFLLTLCLIPFSTTLYARNADDMLALVVYAGTFAIVSLLLAALDAAGREHLTLRTFAVPTGFLLAIPMALVVGPMLAPWAWLALFALSTDRVERALSRRIR
ncbi:MAG: TMEM175 family protein [Actinomycetota bacterium]